MIFAASQTQENKLRKVIGNAIPFNLRKIKANGSLGLFLKSFTNHQDSEKVIAINSKCNFENRENGILLRSNSSNIQMMVALPFQDILKIQLVKGNEYNHLSLFSLGGILHKIGLPLRYARYIIPHRLYRIDSMDLILYSDHYKMTFTTNGYHYENQLDFWKSSSVAAKLVILDKNQERNTNHQ